MGKTVMVVCYTLIYFIITQCTYAENIYELRKLTDQDWISMSTEERIEALNVSNNQAANQTFTGKFGRYYDMYPRWGYDYYEMEDRYENYTFRNFENYNIVEDRRQRWYYNQFGDRLSKMTRTAGIWSETRNDDGSSSLSGPSGYINATPGVNVDGMWVAREETNDWAISIVGAEALRTKLTPLTLSIPNLGGMKTDFQSANYQASFVNALMYREENHALLLRGLQLRRKFGALNVGATYANMYSTQQTREKGTSLKGTVSDHSPVPIYLAVRVLDDSPSDGDGPIVHDVKLRVDGVYRPDITPIVILDNVQNELLTAVSSKSQQNYLDYPSAFLGQQIEFDHLTVEERTPKYLDYLYMNEYMRGWNTKIMTENFDVGKGKQYYSIVDPGGKPLQVSGNQYVVYLFDLGSIQNDVKRVQVELTVANDYRIQTSQIYTQKVDGGHDSKGDNYLHYNASYWRTMEQADGNVKDSSNLRTISIDFGYEVGNVIYGFDAHFNYLGLRIDGEFVNNTHFFMFSDGIPGTGLPANPPTDLTPRKGHRFSQTDHAYYFTACKDWSRFGFAGEVFKMGKFYRPYMNHMMTMETDWAGVDKRNWTIRMTMIEDNDDDDQYPDTGYSSKIMSYTASAVQDPDGVFPGNDLDHDGYADNEKNDNSFPDYNEPFLMFDVDPDEFVFGDDFNNNTIPDFREDDMKYDTPYDLDREGYHYYLRFFPLKNTRLMVGSLRTKGVGLDNRTYDDYFKANLDYNVFSVGTLSAEYRYERIQDDIQDKFVVVPTASKHSEMVWFAYTRYKRYLYYDEVEYRNSRVHKLFLESKIRAIPSITIENHVKYEWNNQIEGTMYNNTFQQEDIVTSFAMVNKFVYTKQIKNWTFSPGIKFRLMKKNRSESINPLDHYMMRIPLIYLKYRVSPKTGITLGIQGINGFEFLYKDYIQDHNDYRQVDYTLQIENRTNYWGFDVWGGFGFRLEEVKYEKEYRQFEEYKNSSFFMKIAMGY